MGEKIRKREGRDKERKKERKKEKKRKSETETEIVKGTVLRVKPAEHRQLLYVSPLS